MCSISVQCILLQTPWISREASANLNAPEAASSPSCCPPCCAASPATLPVLLLPWVLIHPQPHQEVIVIFAFRVAVCVTGS